MLTQAEGVAGVFPMHVGVNQVDAYLEAEAERNSPRMWG